MSSDHYLAGPCEGMSLHRDRLKIRIKDTSGREPDRTVVYPTEYDARQGEWTLRAELYAKYEGQPQ